MSIFSKILKWANNLPTWQSDAVRRILIKGDLDKKDQEEILNILKNEKGIKDPKLKALTPIPLKQSDLPTGTDESHKVIIKSIYNLKNVNALALNQSIKFAIEGISLTYGDNASGKSGYSRVLKKACRARGEEEEILPDVFSNKIINEPAEAIFEVAVDGKELVEKWIDNYKKPESLASIAVFDSKAARFYVEEGNEVVYIPYGMDIFEKLGKLCRELRTQLENELPAVVSLPGLHPSS